MKNLLFLLFSLFFISQTIGQTATKCGTNGLWVRSTTDKISINTLFLLESYGESQNIIDGLNGKYSIYLQSGKEKIQLKVIEINGGQFHLKQALLKPEKALNAGFVYSMHIDNLPEGEKLIMHNGDILKPKVEWTALTYSDTKGPRWMVFPQELPHLCLYNPYDTVNITPTAHLISFACKASDKSEVFVKTSVKNLTAGSISSCYLVITPLGLSTVVTVGYGQCGGYFHFERNTKYEVKFELMDASGNMAEKNSDWLPFEPTFEKTVLGGGGQ